MTKVDAAKRIRPNPHIRAILPGMNTIAMTPAKPVTQTLTDAIVRQLRDRLPEVLASGEGGQRVVIHIAPGRKAAKIEWPPDVEEVKP